MASDYTPTEVTQGFGAETQINLNFDNIKTAMDKLLNRLNSAENAMAIDLDMGSNQILNLPQASDPTDPVLFSQLNTLAIQEVVQTLTYAATISVDVETVTFAKLTLEGNPTITFTGTPNDGQPVLFALRQDPTGNRVVTWEARVRISSDIVTAVLSTIGDKLDYVMFRYNADDDKFDLMAINRGF
jgi:hypothetical protein